MAAHGAIEVAKTVMEVADVAWTAVECCHHHHHENQEHSIERINKDGIVPKQRELEALRSENLHLRSLIEQNLKLLQNLSESSAILQDCPSDLNKRLISSVNSKEFLARLESLSQALVEGDCNHFPFKEATGDDIQSAEILINVDQREPSWWVWVPEETVSNNWEERSGIDDENYVFLTDKHVVDGVADFLAKCMLANPKAKNLKPEELQKTLAKELGGESKLGRMVDIWHAGKMFYTLSTWGLALTGLYRTRAVLRIGAMGAHAASKVILKAL